MVEFFKREFQLKKFWFGFKDPSKFGIPLARSVNPGILLGIRVIFFLYMLAMMIVDAVTDEDGVWIEFLTTWNYISVVTYFLLATFMSLSYYTSPPETRPDHHSRLQGQSNSRVELQSSSSASSNASLAMYGSEDEDRTTFFQKLYWFFFAVVFSWTTHVTIMYWGILHDFDRYPLKTDLDTFLIVDRHGINQVLVYVDFALNAVPVRILHFIYPLTMVIVYSLFTVIHWASTDDILYSVLDYTNKPGTAAGVIIGGIFLLFVCQFILYGLFRLKLKIADRDPEEFM